MAKVRIKNMMFYGFHGVYEYEREQGQKFFIDIEVETRDDSVAEADDPVNAVQSATMYAIIRDTVENKRFMLLQALGYHVNQEILKAMPMAKSSTIVIRKPSVPIAGPLDCVEVEVCTSREDLAE
ncbi:MAG: dihydroneopterin aldolase [Selenomonadaceae bacterium]|nr:dihydroneopterin aldolase [Selenomonadaceae bacterium]